MIQTKNLTEKNTIKILMGMPFLQDSARGFFNGN